MPARLQPCFATRWHRPLRNVSFPHYPAFPEPAALLWDAAPGKGAIPAQPGHGSKARLVLPGSAPAPPHRYPTASQGTPAHDLQSLSKVNFHRAKNKLTGEYCAGCFDLWGFFPINSTNPGFHMHELDTGLG